MKIKKSLILGGTVIIISFVLTGCNLFDNEMGELKSAFNGREAIIETYDENSNVIDRIQGKSIDVNTDDEFKQTDEKGNTIKKSSVLNITVGGKEIIHVGSSLVMHETDLVNIFEDYNKKIDVQNNDNSTPIIDRIINSAKNITTGKSKIILIRSQSGQPLATFAGDNVSYFATGMDKSTGILIDGKYLFIYRCDYTIYDKDLLE
ncbi:DUF5052 family protein [Clostridium perfringens]|uniref:DUF5052 family protein n=2 Tax=Clostridium perfringens TaxID=1502 RepID=UPI001898F49D|nr:DUF5052 family protein [Clostridium perfringens]EGT0683781.1 DUF5052 family protein [Clostridium perfringens]EGT0686811.1 DUF5052 family protein [Clostridium perfringens]EIF2806956.1 DUF5052 family protein [Clostridium perfringens]ELC8309360.1 DUF5052 family protein [Clostridium perfringens]ELC8392251.1 DUF5052 family protein [Clostridium perfringens]